MAKRLTILEKIARDLEEGDLTQQVREICEKIYIEESQSFEYPEFEPKGSNVFLTVEVPGRYIKEIGYLTLERVSMEEYLAVYQTIEKSRLNFDNPEEFAPHPAGKQAIHFKGLFLQYPQQLDLNPR